MTKRKYSNEISKKFNPTWLLEIAELSEKMFKDTLQVMLEAHREEAAEFERERIIELLNKQLTVCECDCGSEKIKEILDLVNEQNNG